MKPGDRVQVNCPGLAKQREVMRSIIGKEPTPNHIGTVQEVDGDTAYIVFDSEDGEAMGQLAPYPLSLVQPLGAESEDDGN